MTLLKTLWGRGRIEITKSKIPGGYKFTVGPLEYPFLRTASGEFTSPGLGTFKTLVEARTAIVRKLEEGE